MPPVLRPMKVQTLVDHARVTSAPSRAIEQRKDIELNHTKFQVSDVNQSVVIPRAMSMKEMSATKLNISPICPVGDRYKVGGGHTKLLLII